MATSLLDQYLRFSLLIKFRNEPTVKQFERVFTGYGPLATFAGKIAVAEAFGIVHDDMAHDFKIMRDIRNQFAHSPLQLYLKDMSACLSLKIKNETHKESQSPILQRKKLIDSAAGIIARMSIACIGTLSEQAILDKYKDELKAHAQTMVNSLYESTRT